MDQPQENSIDWIDWWVRQNLQQLPDDTIKIVKLQTFSLPKKEEALIDEVLENNWTVDATSGNRNDCMIHS